MENSDISRRAYAKKKENLKKNTLLNLILTL